MTSVLRYTRCHPVALLRFKAAWLALALWVGVASPASAERPAPDSEAGKAAYGQYCARCHGATGKGDGLDAKRFYPRPRDLTMGVYKFRSTASGTPPTDEDLFGTVTNGLPGSNMPDWQHLDETVRWQLVYYLKSLSPAFQQTQPSPIAVTKDPGSSGADLVKGKAVYEKLGCAACHGLSGRANGTSAAGLVDDWGLPIRPADLTQGWAYRGGHQPRDILMRLLAGIDGAGMPSYAEAITPDEAWHLAYYVASRQEQPRWNMIIRARDVDGALPSTLDDPRWDAAERTDVWLRNVVNPNGEWAQPPTVRAVSFQVVYNDEAMALRLAWDDPTQETQAPPDRLALVLKLPQTQGDVVTLQAWPYTGAPPLDLCVWSADSSQAFETIASAFDGVIEQPNPQTLLKSVSSYADGRWQLLLQRARQPVVPEGAARSEERRVGKE